jgi:gamma-glutamylcyclotransferase (GGCT)/AIG2-like uncharacterized protein YtfP
MESIHLAVNGTLMRGLALNQNLIQAGGVFLKEARTSSNYRLWSIEEKYPAMQRDDDQGSEIHLELWEIPLEGLIDVLNNEPPGLCLGKVELQDGAWVFGILGERSICKDRLEITQWGGWRNYQDRKQTPWDPV